MTRRAAAKAGLGRSNEPPVLILTSLAESPKHGYALTKDIEEFAGVSLGPGTLYGAIARLEERGLIEPEPAPGDERRRPYRITGSGRVALEEAVRDMRMLADKGAARLGIAVDPPALGALG
jgi:DNA-binding PadR family transcriptional regulator